MAKKQPISEKLTEDFIKKIWTPTDNRFVAFIDILGFKDMIMRSNHKEIYDKLDSISKTSRNVQGPPGSDTDSSFIHVVNFSDSIVVFSKSNSINDFMFFITSITIIVREIVENGMLLKCGLAYGLTSVNKENRIFFGQSIIDAYMVEEDINYIGIVSHSTIDRFFHENREDILEQYGKGKLLGLLYRQMKTPLKSGKIMHTNLMWFEQLLDDDITPEEWIKHLESLYTTVSGSPRRYIDNTIEVIKTEVINKKNSD